MYRSLFISSGLIVLGAVLSFIRDWKRGSKKLGERIIPLTALILGLSGAWVSFSNSKDNINEKARSDLKFDSLSNREINLVGGGTNQPLFSLLNFGPNEFVFFILDTSKYTLRDFTITIRDDEKLKLFHNRVDDMIKDSIKKNEVLTSAMLAGGNDYQQEISFPYLTSMTFRNLQMIHLSDTETYFHFTVDINWTGGSLTYYIESHKSDNMWKTSTKRFNRVSGITNFQ